MKDNINVMDCAYDIAKKLHEKDGTFLFRDLWDSVSKKIELNQQDNYGIGEFLGDLMQDVRFVRIPDDHWKLREDMRYDEWDKISKSMLGTKEYFEEGYENFQPEDIEQNESEEDVSSITADLDETPSNDDFAISNRETESETELVDKILDSQEDVEEE